MKKERSSFTSRLGFVLAAAGSAVGLGNLWRFPYLAAKYGGGTFLLVYIILAITFGFTIMVAEIAIGRKTRLSCIGAYSALDKRFGFLGWLASLVPVIITPYYCVIGGWVIKYLVEFLTGRGAEAANDAFFGSFIGVQIPGLLNTPITWFVIYVLLNAVIVLFGVEKGIEKVSRVMMPILVILSILIAGYSLTLPGAMEGLRFYLLPRWEDFSVFTILGAMGQLFYSMSLAMGIMITYGSYMQKDTILEHSVTQIEIFDTGIAMLAGLMIIPAMVAFSGGDTTLVKESAGPGLMFGVLPKVFDSMAFGSFIGIIFFLLVLLAALTSSISLMETIVSIIVDKLHVERKMATISVIIGVLILGLPSCLGYGPLAAIQPLGMAFLDFFDFISNSVLMPIVAFLTCILIGHIVGPKTVIDEVESSSSGVFRRKKLFTVMIRWVAPIMLIIILVTELLKVSGVIKI
ncbi:MAG: sodium-dependent transporter [Butyricicoccus pullicaecorum]|nr:sodium-dependent transporter [Butyricicoccus pullicaecorum]